MHIYIHIPFCKAKCTYCDFVSGVYSQQIQDQYMDALLQEIRLLLPSLDKKANTIYIGGGTPSSLSNRNLHRLLSELATWIDIDALQEFTIECNPESVDEAFVKTIAQYGIRRVSMGVQSANPKELLFLNRIHSFEMVQEAVCLLKKYGIHNISVDLMFHLPNQTMQTLTDSLHALMRLEPTHISCYSLIIEENTPMMRLLEEGHIQVQSDDLYVEEQRFIHTFLASEGFEQYEIANYAKSGFEAVHNSAYWIGRDYLGLGVAAHSKKGNVRYANWRDLTTYMHAVQDFETTAPKMAGQEHSLILLQEPFRSPFVDAESIEQLSPIDLLNELFFLGLRRNQGILFQDIVDRIGTCTDDDSLSVIGHLDSVHTNLVSGFQFREIADLSAVDNSTHPLLCHIQTQISKLLDQQLLEKKGPFLCLTEKGMEISNYVFVELMVSKTQ